MCLHDVILDKIKTKLDAKSQPYVRGALQYTVRKADDDFMFYVGM
jgi:hypothetical protein